eukprot:scaffold2229_cov262-Pinguiococcus_pyrenoidosus.AAC.2
MVRIEIFSQADEGLVVVLIVDVLPVVAEDPHHVGKSLHELLVLRELAPQNSNGRSLGSRILVEEHSTQHGFPSSRVEQERDEDHGDVANVGEGALQGGVPNRKDAVIPGLARKVRQRSRAASHGVLYQLQPPRQALRVVDRPLGCDAVRNTGEVWRDLVTFQEFRKPWGQSYWTAADARREKARNLRHRL